MVERTYTFAIFATILFIIAIMIFMVGFFDIGGKKNGGEDTEENEPPAEPESEPSDEDQTGYLDIYGDTVTLDNVDGRIEEDTNRSILILSAVFAILALVCLIVQLRS